MNTQKKWLPGNVIEILLEDESISYGLVIREPLIAFSRLTYSTKVEISAELFTDIAFQTWCHNESIGKNGWSIVGYINLSEISLPAENFYRYDPISQEFFHYIDNTNDIPVQREDCIDMECAAVWDKNHIEQRLYALKTGKSCIWLESLKAENR